MLARPTPIEREYRFGDDTFIVSKTDPRGVITYANTTFIDISGYSERELLGAPHNVVRHPDMPRAAFADLWATVQDGREWNGLVKNLCKDGGYYWVDATVTPTILGGRIIAYMSVRRKPDSAQIEAIVDTYRAMLAEERSGR